MPRKLTIITILAGLLFYGLQMKIYHHGSMALDSWEFYGAWNCLLHGQLACDRPPVYPIIMGICSRFPYWLNILPLFQWIAYLISLQLVWNINERFNVSKVFNTLAILSMLLIPGFWIYNNIMMAESISLSEIVLLIWILMKYFETHKTRYLCFSTIMLLLLIYTKPMFIFLIPILAIVWFITAYKNNLQVAIIAFSLTITLGSIWWYTSVMERTYGGSTLTIVATINKYCIYRADGAIRPDEITDTAAANIFRPLYIADPGIQNPDNRYITEASLFTWEQLDNVVSTAAKNHPEAEIPGIAYRVKTSLVNSQFFFFLFGYSEFVDTTYYNWNGLTMDHSDGFIFPFHKYLWFPIWISMLILLIFSSLYIRRWIRSGQFPIQAFLVASTVFTCYVTTIFGAQDCWGRIMTPVTPLIPVMATSVATIIKDYVKKGNSK